MKARKALVTGGAGFIGSNLCRHLFDQGVTVHVFDDLSRAGVKHNLAWLKKQAWGRLTVTIGDICDSIAVAKAASDATEIYHLAAQVAVTDSVRSPRNDFEVNALGTLNVLEAARTSGRNPFILFTSTNKVYGSLAQVPLRSSDLRHCFADREGVNEEQPLDFHSPYGCSKGAADQYVHDYARVYGLDTVVFRMSCIAGERQFGTEDQGWVAHFVFAAMARLPITVYGDGRQVRDLLNVRDLVAAISSAHENRAVTSGQVYNIGGGIQNAVSLLELLDEIEDLTGSKPAVEFQPPRVGDQLVYVSSTQKFQEATGWRPRFTVMQTLDHLRRFWKESKFLHAGIALRAAVTAEPDFVRSA